MQTHHPFFFIAAIAVAICSLVITYSAFNYAFPNVAKVARNPHVAGTSSPLLTTGPTDPKKIKFIAPGSLMGADSRYAYIHNKDAKPVPVIAPADGTLVYIAYKDRSDLGPKLSSPDYDVEFQINTTAKYRINHITKPIAALTAAAATSKPVATGPGKPLTAAQTKPKTAVKVKAGQTLGTTTGTPGEHNWDFTVFISNQAVCPFTQLPASLQTTWLGLLGKDRKIVKGTACAVSGSY